MKVKGENVVSAAPIRVLRLVPRLNTEGPVRHVALLSKALQPEFDTLIAGCAPAASEAAGDYLMHQYGVPFITANIDDEATFRQLLHSFQPHVIHTHSIYGNAMHRLWAKQFSQAVIVHTYHGHAFHGHFNDVETKALIALERSANNCTDRVICISHSQQKALTEEYSVVPLDKTSTVPLGLNTDHFSRAVALQNLAAFKEPLLLKETWNVAIIGRLSAVKNHAQFIECMQLLDQKLSRACTAWIVGDGPLREVLLEQVKEIHTTHITFKWLPWQEDIRHVLLNTDVCVCTSHNEGTPLSLLEAMSMEVPVVANSVGGIPDIIKDGHSGFLIMPGNAKQMSEKIATLFTSSAIKAQMTFNARVHIAANYSHHRLVNDIRNLYHTLLKH